MIGETARETMMIRLQRAYAEGIDLRAERRRLSVYMAFIGADGGTVRLRPGRAMVATVPATHVELWKLGPIGEGWRAVQP